MRYLVLLLLLLVACDDARSVPGGGGGGSIGVGTILTHIGEWGTWIFGVCLLLAPVALVASNFVIWLKPFSGYIAELIPCCFVGLASSVAVVWLGDNVWALVTVLVLGCVLLLVRYRDWLIAFFTAIFTRKSMRKPKVKATSSSFV